MIGGVPVSGAVARSGVNVHSGGRTRLSSILHAVFLLLMVLVFGPIAKRIPLASLAAILMVASVRTADWKSLKLMPRAHWSYGVIMTITTILTVVKDLTIAVLVGVALSAIVVLVKLASSPHGEVRKQTISDSTFPVHPNVEVIAFHGPLFFIGVENVRRRVREITDRSILVFDFTNVPVIDETGALAFQDFVGRLQREGKSVYIGGLDRKPLRMLIRMGVVDNLGRTRICKGLESAVRRASGQAAGSLESNS